MDLQTRIYVVELFYENGHSPSAIVRACKKRTGIHNDPFHSSYVTQLIAKFKETGSVADAPKTGRPTFS